MKVVVVGAGGHARSVIDAIATGGELEAVACTDPRPEVRGTLLDGVPVVGDDSELPALLASGVQGACLGIGGVGDNGLRARLFAQLEALGFALPSVVHARAWVAAAAADLGRGTVVMAGATVGPGAAVGADVIVNTGAVVEHDCRLANHVHVASGAVLSGGVTVGEGAHVGAGAVVLQGVTIGARAVVGAGAAVIRDVAADTVVAGCPAAELHFDG